MTTDSFDGVKHVCFDKDGTLTDVHAYWSYICGLRAAQLTIVHDLDLKTSTGLLDAMGVAEEGRLKPGGPVGYHPRATVIGAVRRRLDEAGIAASDASIAQVFAEVDAEMQRKGDYRLVILGGAGKLLESLSRRGFKLTLYTSDRTANAGAVLERIGLRKFFDTVIGGDAVKRPKPDPEGFHLACESVGVPPSQSAYIGDTLDDLKMAATGGAAQAIAVATGLDTLSALSLATPHAYTGLLDLMPHEEKI